MSVNSPRQIGSHNGDGRITQTDESTSSESPISEEAERRASEDESTQPEEPKHAAKGSKKREGKQPAQESIEAEMKGYLNKDYRDLLNSAIEEAAGVPSSYSDVLSPSHIDRSLWTSREKEAFFRALSTKGRDDLPGISRAVQTKSEIEVRSYLLHLQASCSDGDSPSLSVGDHPVVDIPASYEIGERCERAINLTAEALGRHVLQHDIELEKGKFGDLWLIDDDIAARIEMGVLQNVLGSAIDAAGSDVETSDETDAETRSENGEETRSPKRSETGTDKSGTVDEIAEAKLLKAEAFLQLSRSLFMNSAVEPEYNWSQIGPANGGFPGPAIFRSAFENFHNVTINLTRWLVQATVFQTMSRLRAKDEQNPSVIVTTEDVKTALDFLNLSLDWKKYWSVAARRSGVDVYSDSKKYEDGRPGTKNGRLLTWDEVETELGYPRTESSPDSVKEMKEETSDSLNNSDSEASGEDNSDDEEGTPDDEVDFDTSSRWNSRRAKKRKRPADVSSNEDKEDEYLDYHDKQSSRAEERRLMDMLRYSMSPSAQMEDVPEYDGNVRRKRARTDKPHEWRDHVNYIAEWEQHESSREESHLHEDSGE